MLVKDESGKINFIDKNDCFVGFDYMQDCCEEFGWYSSTEIQAEDIDNDDPNDIDGFCFDTEFQPVTVEDAGDDEGGTVAFRMINDSGDVKYLHLFNSHNGYYSHGWDSSFAGEGYL